MKHEIIKKQRDILSASMHENSCPITTAVTDGRACHVLQRRIQ
jgi:hypothetical protein